MVHAATDERVITRSKTLATPTSKPASSYEWPLWVESRRMQPLHRPVIHGNSTRLDPGQARVVRKLHPLSYRIAHLRKRIPRADHAEALGYRHQVVARDAVELAVDAHQVLVGPLAVGVVGVGDVVGGGEFPARSEEHTSELQSLMRTSYAVF